MVELQRSYPHKCLSHIEMLMNDLVRGLNGSGMYAAGDERKRGNHRCLISKTQRSSPRQSR